ncbi:MAG: hypothetical protein OEL55_01490 [Desulfobulbaceae bacterium]|nr:hypothetical protein [Desulfobulbaceae bacterium]
MNIDIAGKPPVDIFRDRGKHLRASIVLLSLAGLGLVLIAYGILSDVQQSEIFENVALGLLVGPAVLFTYYGTKLNDYKGLSVSQEKELANLIQNHAEISAYCALVEQQNRKIIHAEYEACVEWDENVTHQKEQAA